MSIDYLTDPKKKFGQYENNLQKIFNSYVPNAPLLSGSKSLAVYDFEVQQNIYSCSVYFSDINKIIIFYYTEDEADEALINKEQILKTTHAVNDYTIKHYPDFDDDTSIELMRFNATLFRSLFEKPQNYIIGFNSNHYDLVIISFILNYIYAKGELPTPWILRFVSNLIISPNEAFNINWKVSSSVINWANRKFNHMRSSFKVRQIQEMFMISDNHSNIAYTMGDALGVNLYSLNNIYYNLKSGGYHVDMRGLNEKDNDNNAKTASLKRIAAQLGYQIKEPSGVDLSSNEDLTSQQCTDLLAYNVSDILVSTLIFNTSAYQNVLSTREQLLERFGNSFNGKRTVNSTSANFVESVIAPRVQDKLHDQDEINIYYPVHGKDFDEVQKQIDKDYHKQLTYEQALELDKQWTKRLREMSQFKAKRNNKDGQVHERFRVRFGEIQEDLLELLASFDKFPKSVYMMYDAFRGAKSEYEYIDGKRILKRTAREVAVENFVKKHPTPPEGFIYSKDQKTKRVKGFRVDVTISGQPMVLSFSIGGVHGEIMDKVAYERTNYLTNKYTELLNDAKKHFASANDAFNLDDEFYSKNFVDSDIYLKRTNAKRKGKIPTPVSLIVTKASTKTPNAHFKNLPKTVTPKDYVIPIDMANPVHVDVDSLYPSLMINLHMFARWCVDYTFDGDNNFGHWQDVYAKLREERVKLKKWAEQTPKKDWGEEQKHAWAIQLLNKLLLNSASGIADGQWDTNIRMNNKAASMRIMGQLILTYLVLSVEPKGVYSVSTNTDGVYLTSDDPDFSVDDITNEIEEWKVHFHLGATPEIMARFVSKDANNRFEQEKLGDPGDAAGGFISNYAGANSKSKMKQPFIIDAAIVNYFKTHKNVATNEVNEDDLYKFISGQLNKILTAKDNSTEINNIMLSFAWTVQPDKNQSLVLVKDNSVKLMQHVNRLLLVKSGSNLGAYSTKAGGKNSIPDEFLTTKLADLGVLTGSQVAFSKKVTNFNENWQVVRTNLDMSRYFNRRDIWENLDLQAYVNFAKIRITGQSEKTPIWVRREFKLTQNLEKLNNWLLDTVD